MIIDGKAIAADILAQVKKSREGLPSLIVRAIAVAPTAATESYLAVKSARAKDAGMTLEVVRLPDTANTNDVLQELEREGADAVLIQLPLPPTIDTEQVLDAIPRELDADVLSASARAAFVAREEGALTPPVAGAVREILARANVPVEGKRAVVVGEGWLVGKPAAEYLKAQGAEVQVLTLERNDISILKAADIVVSGAGAADIIIPGMLTPGVVLIDAGTSESDGALRGDIDPACAEFASVYTPVPGGVGPIAVACLFQNAAQLLRDV